jgi:hypothetical protein
MVADSRGRAGLSRGSKAWVCGRSLAGGAGSKMLEHGCLCVVSVVGCHAEVCATGSVIAQDCMKVQAIFTILKTLFKIIFFIIRYSLVVYFKLFWI